MNREKAKKLLRAGKADEVIECLEKHSSVPTKLDSRDAVYQKICGKGLSCTDTYTLFNNVLNFLAESKNTGNDKNIQNTCQVVQALSENFSIPIPDVGNSLRQFTDTDFPALMMNYSDTESVFNTFFDIISDLSYTQDEIIATWLVLLMTSV